MGGGQSREVTVEEQGSEDGQPQIIVSIVSTCCNSILLLPHNFELFLSLSPLKFFCLSLSVSLSFSCRWHRIFYSMCRTNNKKAFRAHVTQMKLHLLFLRMMYHMSRQKTWYIPMYMYTNEYQKNCTLIKLYSPFINAGKNYLSYTKLIVIHVSSSVAHGCCTLLFILVQISS